MNKRKRQRDNDQRSTTTCDESEVKISSHAIHTNTSHYHYYCKRREQEVFHHDDNRSGRKRGPTTEQVHAGMACNLAILYDERSRNDAQSRNRIARQATSRPCDHPLSGLIDIQDRLAIIYYMDYQPAPSDQRQVQRSTPEHR
jgi:hypothetical protein